MAANKTVEELTKELAEASAQIKKQATKIKSQEAQITSLTEELQQVNEANADLNAQQKISAEEIKKLTTMLRERTDELATTAAQLESLQIGYETLKAEKATVESDEQIVFTASWKNPKGDLVKRQLTIEIPKVRLPSGDIVFSRCLLKLATGQVPTEVELKSSPKLIGMNEETAAGILNIWAKKNAGFFKEVKD